jgi:RimJ/RimL family protein N-acetyltransferase
VIGGVGFIGFVGLSAVTFQAPFTPCIEIGWRRAYDSWGKGYTTEAASAVLEDAFRRFNLAEIVSFTVPANFRSRRVMKKLGMQHAEEEDFDHPALPYGHLLRRHVLYRLGCDRFEASFQS